MNDLPQQRQAVVAVIQRDDQRFLVVRRAPGVVKPGKLCFPGGMIESGESEEEALQRELREELSAPVAPRNRIWHSVTPWDVRVAWWRTELLPGVSLRPDPAEISEIAWLTWHQLLVADDLLESNREFLDAVQRGSCRLTGLGD